MRDSVPAIGPSTPLVQMTPAARDVLIDAIVNDDDDEAAHSHLAQGNPSASGPRTPQRALPRSASPTAGDSSCAST